MESHHMRKFVIDSQPGVDITTAVENPNYFNTVIKEINEQGIVIGTIPWTPITAHRYDPQPPSYYFQKETIVTETGEIEIPKKQQQTMLYTGENPFIQLIYNRISYMHNQTIEDIVNYIIKDKRLLPDNEYGLQRVIDYIVAMTDGPLKGLLIKTDGILITHQTIFTEETMIHMNMGYDPFEYEIMKHVEYKGQVSRDSINRLILEEYKWARKPTTVAFYIERLIENKNLRNINEEWYAFKKSLTMY